MNTITVHDTEIPIAEFSGQRVVTLAMVDKVHRRPEGTARRSFNENRNRFIEHEDFIQVTADEIRPQSLGHVFPPKTTKGTLLTESGYLMLVKSFTDDLSWAVQRKLVNSYFRIKESVSAEKGLSVRDLVNLQREHDRLMQRLEKEANSDLRGALIESLRATCGRLGRDVPDVSGLGTILLSPTAQHDRFWATVETLIACGELTNHSRKAMRGLIALNLHQVADAFRARRIDMPVDDIAFKRSLKSSANPRFIALKTVNGASGRAIHCWVFERIIS